MKKIFKTLGICLALAALVGAGGITACEKSGFDADRNISVVVREDGSGTKSAFMEIIGLKGKADKKGVIVAGSTAAVLTEVKSNPLAVAYDSLGYVTDDVKKLKVEGVDATVENIRNGTYKIARPLNVVYKEAAVAEGIRKAYLDFLKSTEAQQIIKDNGYVSTYDDAVAYNATSGLSGKIEISGSTSLRPLMEKLAEKFEAVQPGTDVTVGGGGSGQGYNDAKNDVSDFGMISETFDGSKAEGCVYYEVAKDGIAVIVNKANTFDSITMEQLKNIFDTDAGSNAVTVWSQINK